MTLNISSSKGDSGLDNFSSITESMSLLKCLIRTPFLHQVLIGNQLSMTIPGEV